MELLAGLKSPSRWGIQKRKFPCHQTSPSKPNLLAPYALLAPRQNELGAQCAMAFQGTFNLHKHAFGTKAGNLKEAGLPVNLEQLFSAKLGLVIRQIADEALGNAFRGQLVVLIMFVQLLVLFIFMRLQTFRHCRIKLQLHWFICVMKLFTVEKTLHPRLVGTPGLEAWCHPAAEATLGGIAAETMGSSDCAGSTTGTTGGGEDGCSRNGNPGGGMISEDTAGTGTALGARCFA